MHRHPVVQSKHICELSVHDLVSIGDYVEDHKNESEEEVTDFLTHKFGISKATLEKIIEH